MNRELPLALADPDASRRLVAFIEVLSHWDRAVAAPSSRAPRSLASPDANSESAAPRRRERRSRQVKP